MLDNLDDVPDTEPRRRGRPRTINPEGTTHRTSVVLSAAVVEWLRQEADRRKVTIGQVIRECLDNCRDY